MCSIKNPELIDHRDLYYEKKFPDQEQDTPALQKKMLPKPYCGETSYQGSNQLENRTALITGGDSGIGRAAAIAFAREGTDVAIQYFSCEESDIKEVAQIVRDCGRECLLLPADLGNDNVATQLVEKTIAHFNQLDILVLNAAQKFCLWEIGGPFDSAG